MSKPLNTTMNNTKANEKDEFYTTYENAKEELDNYKNFYKNKVIYLNADFPFESEIWNYFFDNFEEFGIKKLITTNLDYEHPVKTVLENGLLSLHELEGDGDFRSGEAIAIQKEADIIITNPPFSLFREWVAQMFEYDSKFIVLGNNNAITYKDIFPKIRDNQLQLGYVTNRNMEFQLSKDYDKWDRIDEHGNKYGRVPAISWYTNLDIQDNFNPITSVATYNKEIHPKYDNYDAIEVSSMDQFPIDYKGVMGVPITYLQFHNPQEFELLGSNRGVKQDPNKYYGRSSYLDGKETFKRLFIKRLDK